MRCRTRRRRAPPREGPPRGRDRGDRAPARPGAARRGPRRDRDGPPGTVHRESDPLISDEQASKSFRRSARALRELESAVLGVGGVVLRYGYFYGPGSAIARNGSMGEDVARRRVPVVGRGTGVWS